MSWEKEFEGSNWKFEIFLFYLYVFGDLRSSFFGVVKSSVGWWVVGCGLGCVRLEWEVSFWKRSRTLWSSEGCGSIRGVWTGRRVVGVVGVVVRVEILREREFVILTVLFEVVRV